MIEHVPVMENWLTGKDLAFDHHLTGAIGEVLFFDFHESIGKLPDLPVKKHDWRYMVYADPLDIAEPAGWRLRF